MLILRGNPWSGSLEVGQHQVDCLLQMSSFFTILASGKGKSVELAVDTRLSESREFSQCKLRI